MPASSLYKLCIYILTCLKKLNIKDESYSALINEDSQLIISGLRHLRPQGWALSSDLVRKVLSWELWGSGTNGKHRKAQSQGGLCLTALVRGQDNLSCCISCCASQSNTVLLRLCCGAVARSLGRSEDGMVSPVKTLRVYRQTAVQHRSWVCPRPGVLHQLCSNCVRDVQKHPVWGWGWGVCVHGWFLTQKKSVI